MKRNFLVLCFLSILIGAYSQGDTFLQRSRITIGISDFDRIFKYTGSYGNYSLSYNYSLTDNLEVGAYFGYMGLFQYYYIPDYKTVSNTLFYGLNAYYHFSQYFSNNSSPKLDLYLKGKIGGFSILNDNYLPDTNDNNFDWGTYAGIAYYPWKRFGIYGEIGYGKYTYTQIGLSLKIGK